MAYGRVNAPSGDFFVGDTVKLKELVPVFDYKYHTPDWSLFPDIESGDEKEFRYITTSDSFCYVYSSEWGMWQLDKQSGKLLKKLDIFWGAKTRATDEYIIRLSGGTITVFDSVTENQVGSTVNNIEDFDITNTHMFYIQGNRVYRSRFNGVQKELIYSGSSPTLVSVYGDDVYVKDNNKICRCSSTSSEQKQKTISEAVYSLSAFDDGVYLEMKGSFSQFDRNLNLKWTKNIRLLGESRYDTRLCANNHLVIVAAHNTEYIFDKFGNEIPEGSSKMFNIVYDIAVDENHIYLSGSVVWGHSYKTKAYVERRQPGKLIGCKLKDID